MKYILSALLLTTNVVFATSFEDNYTGNLTDEQALTLASIVEAYGYRCDSITAALYNEINGEFKLVCNGYRYSYTVEDVGGRYVATVD